MKPLTNWIILDLASAPIDGAAGYLEQPQVPGNYKKPESIAEWHATEKPKLIAESLAKAALDIDLARITCIGALFSGEPLDPWDEGLRDEASERSELLTLVGLLSDRRPIITFAGFRFDLPLLLRRCLYLGIDPPDINLDRYRSPHVDLWNRLSLNGALPAHGLSWYVKRFGWDDLKKPLSGAEEAQVPITGRWDELAASVRHDLEAARRLAVKMGIIA